MIKKRYVIRTGVIQGEGFYIGPGHHLRDSQVDAVKTLRSIAKRYAEAWSTSSCTLRVVKLVPR